MLWSILESPKRNARWNLAKMKLLLLCSNMKNQSCPERNKMLTSGARRSKTKKGSIVQWDSVAPPVAAHLPLVQFQSLPMRNNIYVNVAYRMTNPNPCGTLRSTESKAWALSSELSPYHILDRPSDHTQRVSQSVSQSATTWSWLAPSCQLATSCHNFHIELSSCSCSCNSTVRHMFGFRACCFDLLWHWLYL